MTDSDTPRTEQSIRNEYYDLGFEDGMRAAQGHDRGDGLAVAPCDPPTTHRYETVKTADGRYTSRLRCKRCGYEREG